MAGKAPTTAPTDVDPRDFLDGLEPRRREEGLVLLDLMQEATGAEPVMWGPSMVGYGSFRYRSASGASEGDWFRVGFSPRKAKLTFYGLQGHPRSKELLADLGPHTLGAGCVYALRLEHLDLDVLRELIAHGYTEAGADDGDTDNDDTDDDTYNDTDNDDDKADNDDAAR